MRVLASTSLFSMFTYIAPILQDITGVSPHGITLMLLLFGVGLTAGSFLGGRLADRRLLPSLVAMALAVMLVLAAFSQTSRSLVPAAITLVLWGRSEEHTSELQSLMRISFVVFCLKKKTR